MNPPVSSSNETWVPPACTLPTADVPLRVAEFDDLFGTAVREVARPAPDRLHLDLDPSPDTAARAAHLMTRETGCCSFFGFTLTATGGALSLEVTVPASQIDVLDALDARASAGQAPS